MSDEKRTSDPSTEEVVEEVQKTEGETVEETSEERKEAPNVSEDEKTPANPELDTGEQTVPYSRFKKVNDELKNMKNKPVQRSSSELDVDDFIEISASLKGLDRQEQEWLTEEHKATGRTLSEVRKSEKFKLLQSAYKAKVAKDKSLRPSNKQDEADKPQGLLEKLAGATIEEKQKILEEAGRYKRVRPKTDRVVIGG